MLEQFCKRIPGSRDEVVESKEHTISSEVPCERRYSKILVVEPKLVIDKEDRASPISMTQDQEHDQLVACDESNNDEDKSLVIVENDVTRPEVKTMEEGNTSTKSSVPSTVTCMHQLVKSPLDSGNKAYEDKKTLQPKGTSPIQEKVLKSGAKIEGEERVAASDNRVSPSPPPVTPTAHTGLPLPVRSADWRSQSFCQVRDASTRTSFSTWNANTIPYDANCPVLASDGYGYTNAYGYPTKHDQNGIVATSIGQRIMVFRCKDHAR